MPFSRPLLQCVIKLPRQAASLRAFQEGELAQMRSLEKVPAWFNTQHAAYTAAGMLSKRPVTRPEPY